MALRTSWLARPPTAAANGGRVPLAVLERHRTKSVFTEAWKEGRREKNNKGDFNLGACNQVQTMKTGKIKKKKDYSLYFWELHSLLQSVSAKPQHPVNTCRHQSKTAHNWKHHISITSYVENHSQDKYYSRVQEAVLQLKKQSNTLFTQCWEVYCAAPGRCPEPTWQHGSVVRPDGQILKELRRNSFQRRMNSHLWTAAERMAKSLRHLASLKH